MATATTHLVMAASLRTAAAAATGPAAVKLNEAAAAEDRAAAASASGAVATATADQQNQRGAQASQQAAAAQNPPSTRPPPGTGSETSVANTGQTHLEETGFSVHGIQEKSSDNRKLNWGYLKDLGVWKYGKPGQDFNSWGMLRNTQAFRYNEYGRGQGQRHSGTDIAAREGTPMIAPYAQRLWDRKKMCLAQKAGKALCKRTLSPTALRDLCCFLLIGWAAHPPLWIRRVALGRLRPRESPLPAAD